MEDASETFERDVIAESERGVKFRKQFTYGALRARCSSARWCAWTLSRSCLSLSTYSFSASAGSAASPGVPEVIHTRLFLASRPQYPAVPGAGPVCPCSMKYVCKAVFQQSRWPRSNC